MRRARCRRLFPNRPLIWRRPLPIGCVSALAGLVLLLDASPFLGWLQRTLPTAVAAPMTVEVEHMDQGTLALTEFTFAPDWRCRGLKNGVAVEFAARDLLRLSFTRKTPPPVPAGSQIVFPSGEVLGGLVQEGDLDKLRVFNFAVNLRPFEVPVATVAHVLLDERQSSLAALRFRADLDRRRRRPNPPPGDTLLLANGDQVNGTLLQIHADSVLLDVAGRETSLPRPSVRAVSYDPGLVDYRWPTDLYALLRTTEGSRLFVTEMADNGATLTAKTAAGFTLQMDPADVVDLSFRNGRAVYLSDLDPTATAFEPFLDERWPLGRDATPLGTPLTLGTEPVAKGLGMAAGTTATYTLSGFARLEGRLGLSREAGALSSVQMVVRIDGREAFVSPLLGADDAPAVLNVPLPAKYGPHEVSFHVDRTTRGTAQDFAVWADLRAVRAE